MDTFPLLYTNRLKLRKIDIDDIPLLVKYGNNKKVSDYVLNIPYPYSEPDAVFRISYVIQGFKNKLRHVFAIVLKENNEFIGEIGLHMVKPGETAQLGYWIGEPLWNNGYISEAVEAVLKFGFEQLQLNLIYATCHQENIASGKVLEKNGMYNRGVSGNVATYSLAKDEYLQNRS